MNIKSKGVIIQVLPDADMPVDKLGNIADVVMDPKAVPSRMNSGRIFDQYINGISRKVKHIITTDVGGRRVKDISDEEINNIYQHTLNVLEVIGTQQYPAYLGATMTDKRVIIKEIIEKEFFMYYTVSADTKPHTIVLKLKDTIYAPIKDKVSFKYNGKTIVTKENMMIAPLYMILLAKTADNFLSAASAKTNHYGLPIGVSGGTRDKLPWRNSPVKNNSETEGRLLTSYVSQFGLVELKDRGNSIETHTAIYNNILEADKPTAIDKVIDRNKNPYGTDASLELVNSIFNAAGISIVHREDKVSPYNKE